jgi:hypothetical protein
MIKIRSSTLFHALCWAIGLMAVGLLAMVALMVYPLLFGGNDAQAATASPRAGATPRVTPVRVRQDFNTMQVRFWPPEPVEPDELDVPGDAVDAYEKIVFIGAVVGGGPDDCAVFQNQTDRKQWVVFLNQKSNGVKLLNITDKLAVVDFGDQKVKLNRTKALASKTRRTTRRGSSSRRTVRTSRTTSASRASRSSSGRTSTSSSVRTYGGGASARSSSGRTSTSRPRTSNTSSSSRRSTGGTTSTSGTQPTSSTGAKTSPGVSGAGGSAPKTTTGVNWRKYWNDRMKQRSQQK